MTLIKHIKNLQDFSVEKGKMYKPDVDLHNILQEIAEEKIKLTTYFYNIAKGDMDENTNIPINYDYSKSNTFFTPHFLSQINKLTENCSNFNKLTKKQKALLQFEIDKLSDDEFSWKLVGRKFIRIENPDQLIEYFHVSYGIFEKFFNDYSFPSEEQLKKTERSYRYFFNFKVKLIINHFSTKLNNLAFQQVVEQLNDEDYKKICKTISPKDIFADIIKIMLNKAYESIFISNLEDKDI